jgi:2-dehydro-3-deoxygluconokinase
MTPVSNAGAVDTDDALVTFGETMLRLSQPRGTPLSRVDDLSVHVGGAESNVAVAASNLGTDAAWLSALPDTALGERVAYALRGEGVAPLVRWTDEGRVGTYYFEDGGAPRGKTVVYDRTATPIRDAAPADLPLAAVERADSFYTSGITPALSDQAAATTGSLLATASEAGATTALDVNYRSKLWSPAAARETLTDLFGDVDVLFTAERDARDVLGVDGDAETIARELATDRDFEQVVVTRGEAGALAVADGTVFEKGAVETDTHDPVGSGDAFVGGYLARLLDGGAVGDALAWGVATAALKRTVDGDVATVSRGAVEAIVADDGNSGIDR